MSLEVLRTPKMLIGGKLVRSESQRTDALNGVNIPRGSRKDVRDAVLAAHGARTAWQESTVLLRGQIIYRIAELLQARKQEFAKLCGTGGGRQVERAIDTLIWHAGVVDKLALALGSINPVSGSYLCVSWPEPVGIAGLVPAPSAGLEGCAAVLGAALAAGNVAVLVAPETISEAVLTLGEIITMADVPAGVVGILSGRRAELLEAFSTHRGVDLLLAPGCTQSERVMLESAGSVSVRRTHCETAAGLDLLRACVEIKTMWHPTAA